MDWCDKMKCPKCGVQIKKNQKVCEKCKRKAKKENKDENIIILEEEERKKGIIIAILLFTPLVLFGLLMIYFTFLNLLS